MFSVFLSAKLIFADGILTRKKSQRKISSEIILYKTEKLGFKKNAPIVYVVSDGTNFAHGKTASEAVSELSFKTSDKGDLSDLKEMPLIIG
jgi:hypothetical protein